MTATKTNISQPTPCVSVIMPVYNCERTLVDTLLSVLTQDLANIEVICVDDGSTDRTAYIVEQLAEVDARLRLVSQKNAGPGAARNAGIDVARGEFLCFMDGDDLYEEASYLRELYEGACDNGQKAAAGCFVNWRDGFLERDFAGTEYDAYAFAECGVVAWEDYQFDYGFHRFLFARELFEGGRNRFSGLRYFEDPVFLVGALADAGSFYASCRAHYLYRCEYRPRDWTTGLVLDFLQGAGENLAFSREHGLPLLHWYTLMHMEYPAWEIGIGANRALAVDVIDEKLKRLEAEVDLELLAQGRAQMSTRFASLASVEESLSPEAENPWPLRLRQAVDGAKGFHPVGNAYRWARYRYAHR